MSNSLSTKGALARLASLGLDAIEKQVREAKRSESINLDLADQNQSLRERLESMTEEYNRQTPYVNVDSSKLSAMDKELTRVQDRAEALSDMLHSVEWVEPPVDRPFVEGSFGVCSSCWNPRISGHAKNCMFLKAPR